MTYLEETGAVFTMTLNRNEHFSGSAQVMYHLAQEQFGLLILYTAYRVGSVMPQPQRRSSNTEATVSREVHILQPYEVNDIERRRYFFLTATLRRIGIP